ncbi:MAG: hypothetical protein ACLFR1_05220, partial [Spirochaetia bacterium]
MKNFFRLFLLAAVLFFAFTACQMNVSTTDDATEEEVQTDEPTVYRVAALEVYDADGELSQTLEYEYNADNQLTRVGTPTSAEDVIFVSLTYNTSGQISETRDGFSGDWGNINLDYVYQYHSDGRISSKECYDSDGNNTSSYSFSYNSDGHVDWLYTEDAETDDSVSETDLTWSGDQLTQDSRISYNTDTRYNTSYSYNSDGQLEE